MSTNEKRIWDYFTGKGLSPAGAAGLMGNLYAESGLNPQNLQNTYEKKLGYTDAAYTAAVDSGKYQNFVHDSAGYGLAQWTYWSRKQNLLAFARAAGKSIGDLDMQLDFLFEELSTGYKSVLSTLKTATAVRTASDSVLLNFERPANQGEAVKIKRAGYGQTYYDKYAAPANGGNSMSNSSLVNYTKLSPNHSGKRTHAIDRITPHCVVGQCSVETLGNVFAPTSRQASCNYGIGVDGRVLLCVDEGNRSWCTSSNANDQRAVTIECASDTTAPYAFKDVVYQKLITLCVDICKRNGKKKLLWLGDKNKTLNYSPKSDEMVLTVHRWFTNKSCPGDWMYARMATSQARSRRSSVAPPRSLPRPRPPAPLLRGWTSARWSTSPVASTTPAPTPPAALRPRLGRPRLRLSLPTPSIRTTSSTRTPPATCTAGWTPTLSRWPAAPQT